MRWKLERTTGVFALLLVIGCFLTTVQPMAAEPARLAAAAAAPAAAEMAAETETLAPQAPAAPVRVAVYFEGVAPGTRLILSGPDGAHGTAEAPESGCLTLTLRPGAWGLAAPDGMSAGFTLHENASVDAVTGDAWTDGERLVFSREVRGSVRVRCAPSAADRVLRLTGGGIDEQRAAAASDAAQVCVFWGLPAGSFVLASDGAVDMYITIADDARDVTVKLGG